MEAKQKHMYQKSTFNDLTLRHNTLVDEWETNGLTFELTKELVDLDHFIENYVSFDDKINLRNKPPKLKDELLKFKGKNLGGDPDQNSIWSSQRNFAAEIFKSFTEKNFNIVIGKAPIQYGKTDTMFQLANYHIRNNGELGERVLFVTAMRDKDLYEQNKRNLMDREYITDTGKKLPSNIYVIRMNDLLKKSKQIFKDYKIKYVFFDESDYGSGKESSFDLAYFRDLIAGILSGYKTLLMSATCFDACHAVANGKLSADVVEAVPSDKYIGVNQMLEYGMIENNHTIVQEYDEKTGEPKKNKDGVLIKRRVPYQFYNIDEETNVASLSSNFKSKMDKFTSREGGSLGIIRINDIDKRLNDSVGNTVSYLLEREYKDVEVITIGVKYDSIKEILSTNYLKNKVQVENKKVLLIVINALTAGKDLDSLKELTNLIIETRMNAIANGVQGLAGRVSGYHGNTDIDIVASKPIISLYGEFENDWRVVKDQEYIDQIKEAGVNLSTNLGGGGKKRKDEHFVTIVRGRFSKDDILNKNQELLSLFDNELFGTFDELKNIIVENKQTRANSAINSQRLSKYQKSPNMFHKIWDECVDGTIIFDNRFHRFRAYGNLSIEEYQEKTTEEKEIIDKNRKKQEVIKRGIIYNDEMGEFFIVDRSEDKFIIVNNKNLKNTSQYWS